MSNNVVSMRPELSPVECLEEVIQDIKAGKVDPLRVTVIVVHDMGGGYEDHDTRSSHQTISEVWWDVSAVRAKLETQYFSQDE